MDAETWAKLLEYGGIVAVLLLFITLREKDKRDQAQRDEKEKALLREERNALQVKLLEVLPKYESLAAEVARTMDRFADKLSGN